MSQILYPISSLTPGDLQPGDFLPFTDVSDTTQALTGSTKRQVYNSVSLNHAGAIKFYSTVQAAINAAVAGDVVLLTPGTYAEDLLMATAGVTLKGLSRAAVLVQSLTVTAADCNIESLKVTGATIVTCTTAFVRGKHIRFQHTEFAGNFSIGTAAIQEKYGTECYGCIFSGDETTQIYINVDDTYPSSIFFHSCRVDGIGATNVNKPKFKSICGRSNWHDCRVEFNDFDLDNTSHWTMFWIVGGEFICWGTFVSHVGSANVAVFTAIGSRVCLSAMTSGAALTISGKYEIDLFECACAVGGPNTSLVFNSGSLSRFLRTSFGVDFIGLSGTGLANYLIIYHCSFGFASPGGIHGDSNNVWSGYVDSI